MSHQRCVHNARIDRLHHVIIIEVTVLPSWLALSRDERHAIVTAQVEPALAAHTECSLRWLDAEAMTAQCSDVMLVETDNLRAWHHLWEQLRDSDLFAKPYFHLESIIVGSEDAYLDYEDTVTLTTAAAE